MVEERVTLNVNLKMSTLNVLITITFEYTLSYFDPRDIFRLVE